MKLIVRVCMPVLILGVSSPIVAATSKPDKAAKVEKALVKEPVFVKGVGTQSVSNRPQHKDQDVADATQANAMRCMADKKEKKKKSGLGGLLRAARNSGLLNVVAGNSGAGAVVSSVANTAIDVAASETDARPAETEHPGC